MKDIIKFLDKVIGKYVYTDELVYELENGSLQGIYSDQIAFSNLKYNTYSINFDMFVLANELIYELNQHKEKTKIVKDYSGIGLFGYNLAKRKSSGDFTGFVRFVSGTLIDAPTEGIVDLVYNLKIEEDNLSWSKEQFLYRDQPNNDKTYKTVAFDSTNTLFF
ncbi:hypothetical protein ALNOE001_04690 [Candidatus Methanobinarius endosymbioticus]|uniref:Uncharacterized protein n=1 Tax=Candidatus Methanobinarius endosymbioticus TaxID=2006182 RepID=A0A366MCY0_9EURY|nr:hypothetical protein ALNOE001_04690 [Candidatus Methanobinarius endosymbioticus]